MTTFVCSRCKNMFKKTSKYNKVCDNCTKKRKFTKKIKPFSVLKKYDLI